MIKKLPHEANLLRAAVFVLLLYDRIRKIYIYTFERKRKINRWI